MSMFYSAQNGGFYDAGVHETIPSDAVPISDDLYQHLLSGAAAGLSVVADQDGIPRLSEPPTSEETRAAARAAATSDRETLCRALHSQGKLSGESAIDATAGRWPVEFNAVIQGMTPAQVLDAKISWAGAATVRYANPVLQAAALAFCQGNAAAATALLDQLFGIA